jgi:phenylpropionate dioxygenase-like ring-hydroxylating dioxygenase large terminal subunit|tara:strand:- start:1063 stop:1419 length:357 start_codon:yes stop_codon:yes gene_type:complete
LGNNNSFLNSNLNPPERGQIIDTSINGRDLIVWRTENGVLCTMEARCPHQWTHLASEGVVDGEEIICMTHFWRFSTLGEGCKLNVKGRRDPKGDIEVFPCYEKEGKIWIALEGEDNSE